MRHTAAALEGPIQQALPLGRLLRGVLVRRLVVLFCLCTGIGLCLVVMYGGLIGAKFVYSYAIGLCCWLLIDGIRLLVAAALEHRRRARGEPWRADPLSLGWKAVLPFTIPGMALGPSLGLTLADALTGFTSPSLWSLDSTASRLTLLLTLGATTISVVVGVLQERLQAERARAEAARHAQTRSQLKLLQSQLEPHMLFNTLANLRVLIGLDASRAQEMLDRLIDYLRATLQASRAERHPLAAEFERLADYLALMQVRMGPRLQVQMALPDELREVPVPPLILQPLVENSVLHGLEPRVAGGRLAIEARRERDQLVLTVTDGGVGLGDTASSPGSTGFGLEQVRQRLTALYGAQACFSLQPGPDGAGAVARIELPLDPLHGGFA